MNGMAQQISFDITSKVDLQEVDNAVNQARKEIAQRYDFKGSTAQIEFNQKENTLILTAEDKMKVAAMWEILQGRMVRRNVPVKNLTVGELLPGGGSSMKQTITLQQGIPGEKAKDIVKFLKDKKLKKVQAAIEGDKVRVSSPSKDDLQGAIALLRGQDFGVDLQFGNFRD
jgi:cyclic-di-GMP-binding protein